MDQAAGPIDNSPEAIAKIDAAISAASFLKEGEKAMIKEINLMRGDPKGYIQYIQYHIDNDAWDEEDRRVGRELIAELQNTPVLSQLVPHEKLYNVASGHGEYLRRKGDTSHTGEKGRSAYKRIMEDADMNDGGENLVGGDPAKTVRKAVILLLILKKGWRYVACYDVGTVGTMPHVWVQNFGE